MSKKANRKISIHRAKRNLTKTLFINRTIRKLDWRLFINRECPSGGFYISMEKSGQFLSFGTREIFHRRFLSMWKVRGGFYQSGTGISSIVALYQSGTGISSIVAFYQSGKGKPEIDAFYQSGTGRSSIVAFYQSGKGALT